jgi:hypothetical protein
MRNNGALARKGDDHRTNMRKRLGTMISVVGWMFILLLILGPLAFLAVDTLRGGGERVEALMGNVFEFEALICLGTPFIFLISCCFYMVKLGPEVKKGESRDQVATVIIGMVILSGLCAMVGLVILAWNPYVSASYILITAFLVTGLIPLYMLYLLLVSWRSFNKTSKGLFNTVQDMDAISRESDLEVKVKAEEYYMERWGDK